MSELTKKALSAALKELLLTKPFDKITVSDLTDSCGIHRQTFYYHFADLPALVEYVCLSDADEALASNKTYSTWQEGFLSILNLMKKDQPFINNIYHSVSQDKLEKYLYKVVFKLLRDVAEESAKGLNVSSHDLDFIADFYKYAFVGVALAWVGRGMKEEPSFIVNQVSDLMKGSFKNAIMNYRNDKPTDLSKI
jgi:probable dihydroxyacetone kinase regulator